MCRAKESSSGKCITIIQCVAKDSSLPLLKACRKIYASTISEASYIQGFIRSQATHPEQVWPGYKARIYTYRAAG